MPWAETVGGTNVLLVDSDLETNEKTSHYTQSDQDGNDDRDDPFPVL